MHTFNFFEKNYQALKREYYGILPEELNDFSEKISREQRRFGTVIQESTTKSIMSNESRMDLYKVLKHYCILRLERILKRVPRIMNKHFCPLDIEELVNIIRKICKKNLMKGLKHKHQMKFGNVFGTVLISRNLFDIAHQVMVKPSRKGLRKKRIERLYLLKRKKFGAYLKQVAEEYENKRS